MIKKVVLATAFGLLIVGIATPPTWAACTTPKSISTYNPITAAFVYWHSTLAESPGAALVNKFWTGATDETGSCNFLYFGLNPGDIGLNGNFGDACLPAAACPLGNVSVLAAVTKGTNADFLVTQTPETPPNAVIFDFSTKGGPMVPLGRPRVADWSNNGSQVTVSLFVDSVAAGLYDGTASQITGYNILSKASATDPGRLASGYDATPAGTIPAANGAAGSGLVTLDCSAGLTRWMAVQIVTAGGPSPVVGATSLMNCSQSLANPGLHKFSHKPASVGR